jgi:hypothetical protein
LGCSVFGEVTIDGGLEQASYALCYPQNGLGVALWMEGLTMVKTPSKWASTKRVMAAAPAIRP